MFYPLAASSWADQEIAAIGRVIDSDMYTMGENVAAFEEEFAAYHGKKYGVMVNSGRAPTCSPSPHNSSRKQSDEARR